MLYKSKIHIEVTVRLPRLVPMIVLAVLTFAAPAQADDHSVRTWARHQFHDGEKEAAKGNYDKARKLYEAALATVDQMDDSQSLRIKELVNTALADAYDKLGNPGLAAELRNRAAEFHERLQALRTSSDGSNPAATAGPSQGCNPNWSPEFDLIRDPEMLAAARQDWRQRAQQSGRSYQQLIATMEQARDQYTAHLEQVKQSIVGTSAEPVTNFNFTFDYVETCKNNNTRGANLAAQCEYVNTENVIHGANGTIEILHCLAGDAPKGRGSSDTGAAPSQQAVPAQSEARPLASIDVRNLSVDSRPLTDAEMRDLSNTLRWDPESAPLVPGGAARSNLVDDKGHKLGSVLVRWDKTSSPKTTSAKSPANKTDHFAILLENGSSCVFLSSAELDDGQGIIVVSGVTWSGWLTLHQPDRGRSSLARGETTLPYPSLVFKPLTAYSTLSACMTPKAP